MKPIYIIEHGYQHKQYGNKFLPLSRPKCICFYNGRSDRPEREELIIKLEEFDEILFSFSCIRTNLITFCLEFP